MTNTFTVRWGSKVVKQLEKLPTNIHRKFHNWVNMITLVGLMEARKSPGYHDEPLQGTRKGQRSIRLNKSYRAIYEMKEDSSIKIIQVLEITKHEY